MKWKNEIDQVPSRCRVNVPESSTAHEALDVAPQKSETITSTRRRTSRRMVPEVLFFPLRQFLSSIAILSLFLLEVPLSYFSQLVPLNCYEVGPHTTEDCDWREEESQFLPFSSQNFIAVSPYLTAALLAPISLLSLVPKKSKKWAGDDGANDRNSPKSQSWPSSIHLQQLPLLFSPTKFHLKRPAQEGY